MIGNHVLDLFIDGRLVVELKAVARLEEVHYAQLRSYLRATGAPVGLLMNFNASKLVVKRLVHNHVPTPADRNSHASCDAELYDEA